MRCAARRLAARLFAAQMAQVRSQSATLWPSRAAATTLLVARADISANSKQVLLQNVCFAVGKSSQMSHCLPSTNNGAGGEIPVSQFEYRQISSGSGAEAAVWVTSGGSHIPWKDWTIPRNSTTASGLSRLASSGILSSRLRSQSSSPRSNLNFYVSLVQRHRTNSGINQRLCVLLVCTHLLKVPSAE